MRSQASHDPRSKEWQLAPISTNELHADSKLMSTGCFHKIFGNLILGGVLPSWKGSETVPPSEIVEHTEVGKIDRRWESLQRLYGTVGLNDVRSIKPARRN